MCNREAGGIKFARLSGPGIATHGFSVDVVEMKDIAGPAPPDPNGEIEYDHARHAQAKFDGRGAGWLVYGPDQRATIRR